MNKQEVETKLNNIITHVEKTGVPGEEVKDYYHTEYSSSIDMGMNEEDSYLRALISTVNYYRKKLDKMGNRITFLCLGASQPTDYGLSKKVKEIKKKWNSTDMSQADKSEMVEKGITNQMGTPLHTADTTFIESKIGFPIILDEEMSQNLIGVIKQEDKTFPAMIRIYGKKECEIKKIMYTWMSISADQIQNKHNPNYIMLASREMGMKVLPDTKRISIEEYKTIISDPEFVKITYDVLNDEAMNALDAMMQTTKMGHVFLKNARLTGYSQFSSNAGTTSEITKNNIDDITGWKAPIIADLRISDHIDLDVDPATMEELWLLVLPRQKQPTDKRIKFDALGMYINTPVDRSSFKLDEDFIQDSDQDKLINGQMLPISKEMESLHQNLLQM